MVKPQEAIPVGCHFLAGNGLIGLQEMHRKEKNSKAILRLLACIMRKKGKGLRSIAREINVPYSTVHSWLLHISETGLDGIYDAKRPGASCKLSHNQLIRLRKDLLAGPNKCGFSANVWTVPLVKRHVERKYHELYSESGMYSLLVRLGFTSKKPRPRHPEAATPRQQTIFKNETFDEVRDYKRRGYEIFAEDECTHMLGWNVHSGWYLKGVPVNVTNSLERGKFYSFGALYENGFDYMFYKNENTDTFIDFLIRLYETHGKFVMYLDNASYHKSEKVQDLCKKFKGRIQLRYFPPYTPQLNPVEPQWTGVRRSTANHTYENPSDMKRGIKRMFHNGEIKIVKMPKYLTGKKSKQPAR